MRDVLIHYGLRFSLPLNVSSHGLLSFGSKLFHNVWNLQRNNEPAIWNRDTHTHVKVQYIVSTLTRIHSSLLWCQNVHKLKENANQDNNGSARWQLHGYADTHLERLQAQQRSPLSLSLSMPWSILTQSFARGVDTMTGEWTEWSSFHLGHVSGPSFCIQVKEGMNCGMPDQETQRNWWWKLGLALNMQVLLICICTHVMLRLK